MVRQDRRDFGSPRGVSLTFPASMDFLMAAHAQTPQIALVIRAAICDGLHMMHQRCHACSPQPQALLAERMRRDVSVAHLSPATSISLMLIVATGKMLVMPLHQAPMFFAVACPAVGQIGTAAVSAGAFRFRWHQLHLGNKKTSAGICSLWRLVSVLHFCRVYHIIVKPMNGR